MVLRHTTAPLTIDQVRRWSLILRAPALSHLLRERFRPGQGHQGGCWTQWHLQVPPEDSSPMKGPRVSTAPRPLWTLKSPRTLPSLLGQSPFPGGHEFKTRGSLLPGQMRRDQGQTRSCSGIDAVLIFALSLKCVPPLGDKEGGALKPALASLGLRGQACRDTLSLGCVCDGWSPIMWTPSLLFLDLAHPACSQSALL
jgi:hypothetical protein